MDMRHAPHLKLVLEKATEEAKVVAESWLILRMQLTACLLEAEEVQYIIVVVTSGCTYYLICLEVVRDIRLYILPK
jgi:hypothetical protein